MIIFDICDTMYDSNTTFDFLDYVFQEEKKYIFYRKMSKTIPVKIINKLVFKLFNFDLIRSFFLLRLKGKRRDDLKLLVNKFYDNVLVHKERSEIIDLLNKNKNKNKEILLASATIDIVAEKIANEFSVNYISSKLGYYDGICSGKLFLDLLEKKEKFINHDVDLVVTDNVSDLALVKKANSSVILSTDKNFNFWLSQKLKNSRIIRV